MDEMVILESASMRQQLCTNDNVALLDKVGHLITLPETGWATKENVALFYQVSIGTMDSIVSRHKEELISDGYKVLSKKDFENLHNASFKIPNRGLAIFSRRAVLRLGMLLQNSVVAKLVRSYLLNIEQEAHSLSCRDQNIQRMMLQLDQHADQLVANAQRLAEQAIEVKDNAEQLRLQTNMIKAIVGETYKNRDHIKKVDAKVESHDIRIMALEERDKESVRYISPEQIQILKQKVKQKGNPTTIWAKFRSHFNVTRYIHLPESRFQEALEWINNWQQA